MASVREFNGFWVNQGLSDLRRRIMAESGSRKGYARLERVYRVNRYYLWNIVNTPGYLPPNWVMERFGYETPAVVMPNGGRIAPGTIVTFDSRVCANEDCRVNFLPRVPNQRCCSPECSKARRKRQK